MINKDFAEWLLMRFAAELIDAIKNPSVEGDDLLKTVAQLDPLWNAELQETIQQLPR